jgi:hypothetical protein
MIFIPDFSTLLEGNSDKRDQIFAQLRRVYDGNYCKEFGIAGLNTSWTGRITVGVAVTPTVDRYASMFGMLGERFIMIRWNRVGGVDAALMAMDQDLPAKDAAMKQAVHALFAMMEHAPEPTIPGDLKDRIGALAEIVARGRTAILRERDDTLGYLPQPEGSTRLAQQFCQLAKGSARLEARAAVEACDVNIVQRVAFDTMPPNRAKVLHALLNGQTVESSGLARTTLSRVRQDLHHVGLIDGDDQLTAEARALFTRAGILTP